MIKVLERVFCLNIVCFVLMLEYSFCEYIKLFLFGV